MRRLPVVVYSRRLKGTGQTVSSKSVAALADDFEIRRDHCSIERYSLRESRLHRRSYRENNALRGCAIMHRPAPSSFTPFSIWFINCKSDRKTVHRTRTVLFLLIERLNNETKRGKIRGNRGVESRRRVKYLGVSCEASTMITGGLCGATGSVEFPLMYEIRQVLAQCHITVENGL